MIEASGAVTAVESAICSVIRGDRTGSSAIPLPGGSALFVVAPGCIAGLRYGPRLAGR